MKPRFARPAVRGSSTKHPTERKFSPWGRLAFFVRDTVHDNPQKLKEVEEKYKKQPEKKTVWDKVADAVFSPFSTNAVAAERNQLLFYTSPMMYGIPEAKKLVIVDYMNSTRGKIDTDVLGTIGAYDPKVLSERAAKDMAAVLQQEYGNAMYGTTFALMNEELQRQRMDQALGLIGDNVKTFLSEKYFVPASPITDMNLKNFASKTSAEMVAGEMDSTALREHLEEILNSYGY